MFHFNTNYDLVRQITRRLPPLDQHRVLLATAPEGGRVMEELILVIEELEERIAPGGYIGAGS